MFIFKKKNLLPILSASLLLSVSSVLAQEDVEEIDPETGFVIEEVTVTSTKRETNLMETPLAVTALSQEDLEKEGVKSALDLSTLVPNLQIGLSPSDSGVQVAIRGITSNNFTELGDPTVAFHFDGLYSPRPQAGLALMHDVERVEINRGPQGTLFGRNSTAGSINVISSRPKFGEFNGNVAIELGDRKQRTFKGWLNVPVNDVFALRASVLSDQADSYLNQSQDFFDLALDTNRDGDFDDPFDVAPDGIPNVDQRRNKPVDASEAYGAIDRKGARLSARYSPTDRLDWNVIFDYFNDQSPGSLSLKDCEKAEGTFFACEGDQWDVSVNVPGILDMSIESWRSILEWEMTDSITLEHRIAIADQQRFQQYDGSTAYADPDHPAYGLLRNFSDPGVDFVEIFGEEIFRTNPDVLNSLGFGGYYLQPWSDLQLTTRYSDFDSMVNELQFKSNSDASLQWIAGLSYISYIKEDNTIIFDVEDPFCCTFIRPQATSFVQPDRGVRSKAIFAQFDYAASERTNFTAGYRYTKDRKFDNNGSVHSSIGYFLPNPGQYTVEPDPFFFASYELIGTPGNEFYDGFYQADDLAPLDGTLGGNLFVQRTVGSDNSNSASWSKGTWKLGFDHLWNDDTFIYGSIATGFKAGGFGDVIDICGGCGIFEDFEYDPEEVTTYELGLKKSFLDDRLRVLSTVFFSQFENMQQTTYAEITPADSLLEVPDGFNGNTEPCPTDATADCFRVPTGVGTLLTSNVGAADIGGFEVEVDWRPYKTGRVTGWISYLDTEITELAGSVDGYYCFERAFLGLTPCAAESDSEFDDQGNPIRRTSFVGNRLPWSPEWSLTLNYEHNWYLSNGLRLSPYLSVNWQDDVYFNNNNFDEGAFHSGQPAYAAASFSFRVRVGVAKYL